MICLNHQNQVNLLFILTHSQKSLTMYILTTIKLIFKNKEIKILKVKPSMGLEPAIPVV